MINIELPTSFYMGCGFTNLDTKFLEFCKPDLDNDQIIEIGYKLIHMRTGEPIKYYSCFISYSNKDIEFVEKLHQEMISHGISCWYAPEDLKIGDVLRMRIGEQIRLKDKLLIILSENSISSAWVGDEVEKAIEEEKNSESKKLFPIRLDDTVLDSKDDWAEKIRLTRHIGNFSNWQNQEIFEKAIKKLIDNMQIEKSPLTE